MGAKEATARIHQGTAWIHRKTHRLAKVRSCGPMHNHKGLVVTYRYASAQGVDDDRRKRRFTRAVDCSVAEFLAAFARVGLAPDEVTIGMRVLYSPVIGGPRSFEGTVRTLPWQLGDGEWVVHLEKMELAYGEYTSNPGRDFVHAASLEALAAKEQVR